MYNREMWYILTPTQQLCDLTKSLFAQSHFLHLWHIEGRMMKYPPPSPLVHTALLNSCSFSFLCLMSSFDRLNVQFQHKCTFLVLRQRLQNHYGIKIGWGQSSDRIK